LNSLEVVPLKFRSLRLVCATVPIIVPKLCPKPNLAART
jgi:hypothetical protein